jgi:hypothetical protein
MTFKEWASSKDARWEGSSISVHDGYAEAFRSLKTGKLVIKATYLRRYRLFISDSIYSKKWKRIREADLIRWVG